MKSILALASAFALSLTLGAVAADDKSFEGTGCCAKCALSETDTCTNAIQVKEDGKTVTYYLVKNDVSNKFHKNICQGKKDIKIKGKVVEKDGKKMIEATEIELVKK